MEQFKHKSFAFNFQTVNAINVLFCTLILHHFSNTFEGIAFALDLCQYCNVRYHTGYEPVMTFCRSNQIASNSVFIGREVLYLFLFVLFVNFDSIHYGDTGVQS